MPACDLAISAGWVVIGAERDHFVCQLTFKHIILSDFHLKVF